MKTEQINTEMLEILKLAVDFKYFSEYADQDGLLERAKSAIIEAEKKLEKELELSPLEKSYRKTYGM